MKKLFNITDSEKERILEMHINATKNQYLTEQNSAKEFIAKTDSDRMYNFPKTGAKTSNSKFGLHGGPELENYYFESTIGDIVNQSRGNENEYLINFRPLNDAGKYVEYLKIGNVEINGSGSKTFDINKNMKVSATHNGLLAIKRLMDKMKDMGYNGEKATATITIGGTERSSSYKTYNPNAAKNVTTICDTLMMYFALLLVETSQRTNTNDKIEARFKKYTTPQLQNFIKGNIDYYLVAQFLPNRKEWETIKEQLKLKGSESTNYQQLFDKHDVVNSLSNLQHKDWNTLWNNFWNSWKMSYIDNYSVYVRANYPETAQNLITELSNSIANQQCNNNLSEAVKGLFKPVTLNRGNLEGNKKSSGSTTYGSGD